MSFDKQYYEDKRIKLTNQIVKKMEDVITGMGNLLTTFYEDKNALVADLQEVVKLQKENNNYEVEEPKEEKKGKKK